MKIKKWLFLICRLIVGASFFAETEAYAQIKQWTDEHGVTHFEAHGTGKTPAPRERGRDAKKPPGQTSAAIDRTHAGLTLGDNDSSFRNSRQWIILLNDKFGMQGYLGSPSGEETRRSIAFVDGRLSMILLKYKETTLGGWEIAVRTTAEKYGPPAGNGYSEAKWTDGRTTLTLKRDFLRGLDVAIGDIELATRYSKRSGQAAPKF